MLRYNGNSGLRVCGQPSETLGNPQAPAEWARGCPAVVDGSADVEALVRWAVRDQAAVEVSAHEGRHGPRGVVTSAGVLDRYGRLGCMVDGAGSAAWGNRDLHPLARVVVDELWGDVGALIVHHARLDDRPDWMPGAVPKWDPVERDGRGRAVSVYCTRSKRKLYTLVRASPDPRMIEGRRALWLTWWDGLAELAKYVTGETAIVVTDPRVPREPWRR